MSNTLLCQASTRIIFILVYSSVVNMLRSYHAALAKPLSFYMKKRSILCVKRVTLTIPPQAMINDSEMGESPFEN